MVWQRETTIIIAVTAPCSFFVCFVFIYIDQLDTGGCTQNLFEVFTHSKLSQQIRIAAALSM